VDRSAIFVDAGYFLAAGGSFTQGSSRRGEFVCDYEQAVSGLARLALEHSEGMPSLRTYWYDGAPDAVPTTDHLRIGALPYVKVRLGRVIQGEQKGVDALIYRDLMTLARERAITRAYLLSGDEDLREGVVAAQDMGVQVILMGIPTTQRANQSATLIREVDELLILSEEFLRPLFGPRAADTGVAPGAASPAGASAAGIAFGREWIGNARPDQIRELNAVRPRIPPDLDLQLLVRAEQDLGSLRERQDLKYELRQAFWATIAAAAARLES